MADNVSNMAAQMGIKLRRKYKQKKPHGKTFTTKENVTHKEWLARWHEKHSQLLRDNVEAPGRRSS